MKVTTKNIKAKKKCCIELAKKIARYRDGKCRFCGREEGKLDGAHIIPSGMGAGRFRYATDTANIIALCARCHRLGNPSWHSDETWGWQQLEKHCPEVAEYCRNLSYSTKPINVGQVQQIADELESTAKELGIK